MTRVAFSNPFNIGCAFWHGTWEFTAWYFEAGGQALAEKLYAPHNIHPILCGIIGPETAGWFRFPIQRLEDFEGLKIRFAGLGGRVLQRLGASVTLIPGGEIYKRWKKEQSMRLSTPFPMSTSGLVSQILRASTTFRLAPDVYRLAFGDQQRKVGAACPS